MKKGMILLLSTLTGMTIGAGAVGKILTERTYKVKSMSDKHLSLFLMMNQWVKVKQEGKSLEQYFEKAGYKNLAIYGMSFAGETLVNELKNTSVHIVYGIDRNADSIYADIDIVSMDGKLEKVDAIVVTAVTFFEEIRRELSKKIDCPIVSLEDILYEI